MRRKPTTPQPEQTRYSSLEWPFPPPEVPPPSWMDQWEDLGWAERAAAMDHDWQHGQATLRKVLDPRMRGERQRLRQQTLARLQANREQGPPSPRRPRRSRPGA